MSEKRFKLQHINDLTDQEYMRLKKITDNGELITLGEVVDLLNEQQATIQQLQAKLREKEEDERLYANEIVKLNKEAKEVLDFKSLGGDY